MGYRGTQQQLEARLEELQVELAVAHEALADASRKVEVLRQQQAGRLGVWWFRLTLQRALRDDLDAGRTLRLRTTAELKAAIVRHERALQQTRDVQRWLEHALTPGDAGTESERGPGAIEPWRERAGALRGLVTGGLVVIGAAARRAWVVVRPVTMVVGVVVSLVAVLARSDADAAPDLDPEGLSPASAPTSVEQRQRADLLSGCLVVASAAVLAGGGAALWLWVEWAGG